MYACQSKYKIHLKATHIIGLVKLYPMIDPLKAMCDSKAKHILLCHISDSDTRYQRGTLTARAPSTLMKLFGEAKRAVDKFSPTKF